MINGEIMEATNNRTFLQGLGDTLLYGLRIGIDNEARERYGNTGGIVATQDRQGGITAAGTPFGDTLRDTLSEPQNLLLLGVALVLGVVLVKRL